MRSIRSCYRDVVIYTRQVRIRWNILCLALLATFALMLAGCGGISASRTVSPLDFLLPGIIKADPAPAPQNPVAPVTNTVPV